MASVITIKSALRFARVAFTGRLASMTRREAQAIVRAAGGMPVSSVSHRTSLLVVGMDGWPLLADATVSRKLQQAETLERSGCRIRIVSEADFLEFAGLGERRPELRKSYPAQHVCELLGLDERTLRRWELFGLIRSHEELYDFQDIVSLQTIAGLIARGVEPATIARSIRGLASVLPGTERPLAQLALVSDHPGELLAELGGQRVAPDGQLMLCYDRAGDGATGVLSGRFGADAAGSATSDDWFERGQALEDEERLEEAQQAYREAVARQSHFPEAHFNLGNVLRGMDRLEGAEERYRMAVAQDPSMEVAWYNLADLLEEDERLDDAIGCLQRALAVSPAFADAHYNLAGLLDRAGRAVDAAVHWEAYLKLDPDSEWAQEARNRLREGAGSGLVDGWRT